MGKRPECECEISALLRLVQRDYLDNARRTKANIDTQIEKHLDPYFGHLNAEKLTSREIEEYKDKRLQQKASRATINLELATLRRGLRVGARTRVGHQRRAPDKSL